MLTIQRYWVIFKFIVFRNQSELLRNGQGNNQSIKRILVYIRKFIGTHHVSEFYRSDIKIISKIFGIICLSGELSYGSFNIDFLE